MATRGHCFSLMPLLLAHDPLLAILADEYSAATNFGAGSRRGGNPDQWPSRRRGKELESEIVGDRAADGRHAQSSLGGVHGAAAAQGDEGVALDAVGVRGKAVNAFDGGVRHDVGVDIHQLDARPLENFSHRCFQRFDIGVADQHHSTRIEPGALGTELRQGPTSEENPAGVELEEIGKLGQSLLIGEILHASEDLLVYLEFRFFQSARFPLADAGRQGTHNEKDSQYVELKCAGKQIQIVDGGIMG